MSNPGVAPEIAMRLVRIRQTQKQVGASYLLDAGILALYAVVDEMSWLLVFAYLLSGIAHIAIFSVLCARCAGTGARLSDLVEWQIAFACLVQLTFVAIAPEVSILFMLLLFVVFGFGGLIQSVRHSLISWAGAALILAGEIALLDIHLTLPTGSTALQWLFWLVFVATLGRVMLLGAFARSFRSRLHQKNLELSAALDENHRLATTDDLTGALNRRSLMDILKKEIGRADCDEQPLSVAMLDLDNFKQVNDRFGHMTGDEVLKRFSLIARDSLRATDCFGRFGGEEFFVILPRCSEGNAVKTLERYRCAVFDHPWHEIDPGLRVSVSVGLAVYERGNSVDLLLTRADAALYQAKHSGRNRTVVATSQPEHSL